MTPANDRPETKETPSIAPETNAATRLPALAFDFREYQRFVDDSDWTEAQKREFLEAVWQIIVGFVDLGFKLHPVQLAINAKPLAPDSSRVLSSVNISASKELAVAAQFDERAERIDS